MFSSNYPLVMALRSTNVYEERGKSLGRLLTVNANWAALGIHGEHAPKQHNQQTPQGGVLFSKYLKDHLLPQIFFDLWPIFLGTLFICVVERGKLQNSANTSWYGVWQILFEVTSGYATIGLTYGNPYVIVTCYKLVLIVSFNTSSLSASLRKLSKLIVSLGEGWGLKTDDSSDASRTASRSPFGDWPSYNVPGRIQPVVGKLDWESWRRQSAWSWRRGREWVMLYRFDALLFIATGNLPRQNWY
jgi:hypothetical protein